MRKSGPEPRGVLHLNRGDGSVRHARFLPAAELRPFVDLYWRVRWDLDGKAPQLGETLPHPCVHWVTELGRSAIYGVGTARFTRRLEGRGQAFGVRFRPGGFYPFFGKPASGITDRSITLATAFGPAGRAIGKVLVALDARGLEGIAPSAEERVDGEMMDLIDRFLLDRLPAADPRLDTVNAVVAAIASIPGVTRVEDLATRFAISTRSLQRLFSQCVGVSPKWVIKRYRMHEAVERMDAGERVSWSRLALSLGYFDQTHFIKEFKALTGRSPGAYAKRLPGAQSS